MTYKFRAAIFVGVSSDEQAHKEKASIPDQIDTARDYILEEGGEEVLEPFIADGYSRTGYEDFSEALKDIPPLRAAVEAAGQDKYDVLVLDNFDRFGGLAMMILTRFKKYNKQLKSARQSGRVRDPKIYDAKTDETTEREIHTAEGDQIYRIAKLKRAIRVGVKKRVETGKYSHSFPYGYLKNSDGDLELDSPVADLLITFKDKFFEGLSLRNLEAIANASKVPSPNGLSKWNYMSIRGILSNPFYAGKVFRNRWKVTGKKFGPTGKAYHVMRENPAATLYDGKHQALWTYNEHKRILIEMDERYHKQSRYNPRTFTGLLVCSICGNRLTFKQGKYRCRPLPDHIRLPEKEAEWSIGEALAGALRDYDEAPPEPPSLDVTQKAVADLERQITKVQRMTEKEIYTEEQGQERVKELRARIMATEANHEEHERQLAAHDRLLATRKSLLSVLDELPRILSSGEKKKSNRFLRDMLESIEVTPERGYTFRFR